MTNVKVTCACGAIYEMIEAWYTRVGDLYNSSITVGARGRASGWAKGQALQWAASSVQAGLGFLVRLAIRRLGWKPDNHALAAGLAASRTALRMSAGPFPGRSGNRQWPGAPELSRASLRFVLVDFCDAAASSRLLENNRAFLHIRTVARARPALAPIPSDGLPRAGGRSRPLTRPFAMVSSNAASSSPSIRGYAKGAPQRRLHRARERRRRRRVDGASQAGLVAVRAAPRP